MNYSQLKKSLSEKREGLYVEYKRQISDPRKLARAVAAIANSSGGMLYIGVEESDNGKPDIIGVKYDETTHNKDRIINILTDRIEPKIPRLEVESVPRGNRKNSLYVFIISIPPSTLVHGVKDDVAVWKYYIRRPARVDELDPGALLELCKQKNSY
ncbi:MAG: ATP-binding protein, partial [Nitrososphaerales archaeon]